MVETDNLPDIPIEHAENLDISSITTPVKVQALVEALKESNYDSKEIEYLANGFSQGFDIGYTGPKERESFT